MKETLAELDKLFSQLQYHWDPKKVARIKMLNEKIREGK